MITTKNSCNSKIPLSPITFLIVRPQGSNCCPHCDGPLSRSARYSFARLQKSRRNHGSVCVNGGPIRYGFVFGARAVQHTTAVKRLNRYFCFLLLGFYLPVREKWAKMYKSISQHNYLSIFLEILSFFR